jgi:hypothetical protein
MKKKTIGNILIIPLMIAIFIFLLFSPIPLILKDPPPPNVTQPSKFVLSVEGENLRYYIEWGSSDFHRERNITVFMNGQIIYYEDISGFGYGGSISGAVYIGDRLFIMAKFQARLIQLEITEISSSLVISWSNEVIIHNQNLMLLITYVALLAVIGTSSGLGSYFLYLYMKKHFKKRLSTRRLRNMNKSSN